VTTEEELVKNRTKLTRAVIAALTALCLLLLIACGNVGGSGSGSSGGGSGPTIVVGSKNFTEQYILGNMYASALQANGFHVVRKINLGSEQIADRALQKGQIDLYPEYTGTSLVSILPYNKKEYPKTPQATYDIAKKLYSERKPADTMLKPASFPNTYGIFVLRKTAEDMNLHTLGELAKASPKLSFVTFSEFQNRSDGYPNMKKNYPAFHFNDIIIVNDLGLRYQGLQNDKGDVGVGFTTDGQLTSNQLVVMKDKKNIFPQYYVAPVVRSDTLKKYPKIEGILNKVTASLDVKTMRELNAKVDLQHEDPADVANAYLKQQGIVK
jgi:osmoprotectant transport system substrate-binding protein